MTRKGLALLALLLCVGSTYAAAQTQSNPQPTFRFMNPSYRAKNFSEQKIIDSIRQNFDVSSYREVRIAMMNDSAGTYAIVQLLARKVHRADIARLDFTPRLDVKRVVRSYKMTSRDLRNQLRLYSAKGKTHSRVSGYKCPDNKITFLAFGSNDFSRDDDEQAHNEVELEQKVTRDVEDTARQRGHNVKTLIGRDGATHDNFLSYLQCPNLKGVFYDGDATPDLIVTNDGVVEATEIAKSLRFKNKVTHIWLACQAFKDPMLQVMLARAQSQKYAAGITDLLIGPSDLAAACAMKAALNGKGMTDAFWECVKTLDDEKDDQWGFDGRGSDLFGK